MAYNPETVVLSIYPNELNTYVHVKTYTWVFQKQYLYCQNLETFKMFFSRWMDKLWYFSTAEYYLALPGLWLKVFFLNCRAVCLPGPKGGAFLPATHFRARGGVTSEEGKLSPEAGSQRRAGGRARTGWAAALTCSVGAFSKSTPSVYTPCKTR